MYFGIPKYRLGSWSDGHRGVLYHPLGDFKKFELKDKLKEKTMDDLQVGDILTRKYSNWGYGKFTVLAMVGRLVALSDTDDPESVGLWYTLERLADKYGLYEQPKVKEMTVADVEKLVGTKVKIVK